MHALPGIHCRTNSVFNFRADINMTCDGSCKVCNSVFVRYGGSIFKFDGMPSGRRNPPTPALAKAGAAPGTTAGVELVSLSNRNPKATSMASYGRPSLPFASP